MNNLQKATLWGMRLLQTIKWGFVALLILALIGSIVGIFVETGALVCAAIGAYIGLCAGATVATVPTLIALWFLFLHMVGQVSASIRNG